MMVQGVPRLNRRFVATFVGLAGALLLAGCSTGKAIPFAGNQIEPAGLGTPQDYELQGQQERDRASLMMILTSSRFH